MNGEIMLLGAGPQYFCLLDQSNPSWIMRCFLLIIGLFKISGTGPYCIDYIKLSIFVQLYTILGVRSFPQTWEGPVASRPSRVGVNTRRE